MPKTERASHLSPDQSGFNHERGLSAEEMESFWEREDVREITEKGVSLVQEVVGFALDLDKVHPQSTLRVNMRLHPGVSIAIHP